MYVILIFGHQKIGILERIGEIAPFLDNCFHLDQLYMITLQQKNALLEHIENKICNYSCWIDNPLFTNILNASFLSNSRQYILKIFSIQLLQTFGELIFNLANNFMVHYYPTYIYIKKHHVNVINYLNKSDKFKDNTIIHYLELSDLFT